MGVTLGRNAIFLGVVTVVGVIFAGVIASVSNINSESIKEEQPLIQQIHATQDNEQNEMITETKKELVAYETKTIEDSTIEYGQSEVRTEGSYGEKTYTYDVTYKNGEEVSRKKVKEEIAKQPTDRIIAKGTKIVWRCVDATSYNKNPYDDNKCKSSTGEVRYVSDSQARALDSTYSPGQSGHPWYNSK